MIFVFFVLAAGTLSVCLLPACQSEQAQENKPNIIYILADDLGYADLGSYGQQIFITSNLDKLAGSNVCAPSPCVLMTGLSMAHNHCREYLMENGAPTILHLLLMKIKMKNSPS